ncbi:vesicle-associated membrane protein [Striga asiatica]|uniref:Vesicle-associated membrane protein n=1 Tax=Striga asiatica TaxID=4170 RepID=A0A5A7R760_STRAF|nr:vesicle-associated membrane protein [Striga asiatica]
MGSLLLGPSSVAQALHYCSGLAHPTNTTSFSLSRGVGVESAMGGQESFIYSFVARGTVVLSEYTEFTGNFPAIAAQCLQKLPSSNNKFTYKCDNHIFNFLVEDGYACYSGLRVSPKRCTIARAWRTPPIPFWWRSGGDNSTGIHWKKWAFVTLPKKLGGLGFHDLQLLNDALILKQLWRVETLPNLLALVNQNASWLWSIWMSVRDRYKKCLQINIGDGISNNIWGDPWASSIPFIKSARAVTVEPEIQKVWELMEEGGRQWNIPLVKQLFSDEDSEKILKIKNLDPHKKDRWIWNNEAMEKFSVAKVYSKLVTDKFRRLDIAESSTSANVVRKVRNRTWQLKVKGKLKHFMWKCFSAALPVKSELRRRGLFVDAICSSCGEQEVWKNSPIYWDIALDVSTKFRNWWQDVCSVNKLEVSKARILWVFKKEWLPAHVIVKLAMKDWQEFANMNSR